jgi:hypothetical protein
MCAKVLKRCNQESRYVSSLSELFLVLVGVSDPGVPGPTSKFVAKCPCPDGLARDGTQGESAARIISYQGVLVVGVTSVRERERE